MKLRYFTYKTIATAVLSFALCPFLPWWTFAIFAAVVAVGINKGGYDFLSGFLGVALFVIAFSIKSGSKDHFIFSGKIAEILSENLSFTLSTGGIIAITAVIFGLIGGLAAQGAAYIGSKQTA